MNTYLSQAECELIATTAKEVMEAEDNRSVVSGGSTISTNQEKTECPYCNKDFQIKSMVNHIHSKHNREFLNGLTKKWLEEAEKNRPLKLYWEKPNDFDEIEVLNLYACMGTFKTFMTEERALLHFKKNPDALKKHNKEITKLKKDYEKKKEAEKKEKAKNPTLFSFKKLSEQNDPDLVKSLYRNALHLVSVIDPLLEYTKKECHPNHVSHVGNQYGQSLASLTLRELTTLYQETKEHLENAIKEKLLQYNVLHSILKRLERVLHVRDMCIDPPRYAYYKTESNPHGRLLSGTDKFGFAHPDMPLCPF